MLDHISYRQKKNQPQGLDRGLLYSDDLVPGSSDVDLHPLGHTWYHTISYKENNREIPIRLFEVQLAISFTNSPYWCFGQELDANEGGNKPNDEKGGQVTDVIRKEKYYRQLRVKWDDNTTVYDYNVVLLRE